MDEERRVLPGQEAPPHVGYNAGDLDQEALLNHLRNADALAIVLRSHLYVEARLWKLVEGMLPHPDRLEWRQVRYGQLTSLANALGVLMPGQSDPLMALNRLRNKFAHDLQHSLTRRDVDALYASATDLWFAGLLKGQRTGGELEDLRTFVITLIVGLTAKLQRVARVRDGVRQLNIQLLEAYAGDGSGSGA